MTNTEGVPFWLMKSSEPILVRCDACGRVLTGRNETGDVRRPGERACPSCESESFTEVNEDVDDIDASAE